MFWGISEALDLYHEYLHANKQPSEEPDTPPRPKCLNILMFGGSDPRHVIKTMAKLYTHEQAAGVKPTVNIYMIEGCIEIVARNLALLGIALESDDTVSLLKKVHLYMDVYGNALLRPSSDHYLTGKSKALQNIITDSDVLEKMAPQLRIDAMKHCERDGLENAFRFWQPREGHVFDIQHYWTVRVRGMLGVRYDHRDGAFDWDLNMQLKDRDAQQICSQEYRHWRETGIAFTYPEYEQCKPNKTLVAGLVANGEKFVHRGYVGDMVTGPFCAHGLHTLEERMTHSSHGENDYRATDITERNLLEYFHELKTRTAYKHDLELSRKYGSVRLLMGKQLTANEYDCSGMRSYDKPWLHIDGVQLHLLSSDELFLLQDANGRWRDFFDVAFVGNNYFSFLRDTFGAILRLGGLLILETKLWTTQRKEGINEFEAQLKNYAKTCKFKSVLNYNALNGKHSILKFIKTSSEHDDEQSAV